MFGSTRLQVRRLFATTIVSVALGVGGCTVDDGVGAQRQAATAGSLGGSRTAGGWGNKNLTTEGTLDWAHWGLTDAQSFNYKAGVSSQIGNFTHLGAAAVQRLDCCTDTFSWTDGTPTASATSVIGGVYVHTKTVSGDGFELTVGADTTSRTLELYTGYSCVRAKLEATLSDGSAPPWVDTSADLGKGKGTSVYRIDFSAASSGQTLDVKYTIDLNHCTKGRGGQVWLLAATLAGPGGCTPTTCAAQNKNCGTLGDGCGGTLNCGTCTAPQTCGGGGTPNVCGACTPTSCAAQSKNCGTLSDGCGGTLECGTCTAPQTCGGGGTPNVCGASTGGLTGSRAAGWWNAVSLSTEGTADWAHWGLTGVGSFNHKAGITSQISNFARLGGSSTLWLNCCAGTFSWTGGTPTTSASNVIGGVYVDTPNVSGDGFRITVPANTSQRTLKLYTGYWCVRARLQATLSDGSAPPFVDTSADLTNAADTSIYTLDFKAATSGQTLTVDYTIDLNRCTKGDTGEVWLLGSTLVASPACTPTTCAAQGKNCGSISDGCGGTLDCGTCTAPQICGGSTPNVCGACMPTTCAAQGKNCGSISDGCGGTINCGSCGANQTCTSGGTCACAFGFNDCDGNAANGCESPFINQYNCGTCGNTCALDGTEFCRGPLMTPDPPTWECVSCGATSGNCDNDSLNLCETYLLASFSNCGACGHACQTGQVCQNGSCAGACTPPYTACNGSCYDLQNNAEHCGSCDFACSSIHMAYCSGGTCSQCAGLFTWGNCDGDLTNGCETHLTTKNNCGICGNVCTDNQYCETGCIDCPAGYADCDGIAVFSIPGLPNKSCEVNITSDPANCGACGHACLSGQTCVAGACQ